MRRDGRTKSGADLTTTVNVRLPPVVIAWLDAEIERLAKETGLALNRSDVIRATLVKAAGGTK